MNLPKSVSRTDPRGAFPFVRGLRPREGRVTMNQSIPATAVPRCDMGDCQADATWRYSWTPNVRTVCDAHMQTAVNEAQKLGRPLPRARLEDIPEPDAEPEESVAETKAYQIARLAATKGLVEDDLKRKAPRPL